MDVSKPVNGNMIRPLNQKCIVPYIRYTNTQEYFLTDTGSPLEVSGHHRWVLSVALGISCTFVISVMLLVCWVHWYRSRLLFTSYGTS